MRRFASAIAAAVAARFAVAALLAALLVLLPAAMVAAEGAGFAQEQQPPPDQEQPVEEEDPVEETRENDVGAEENDGAGVGPADEEEGPPWTYQMARLALAALVLLGLAVGAAYYRFVVLRRGGERFCAPGCNAMGVVFLTI
jgi:hypothetical protein